MMKVAAACKQCSRTMSVATPQACSATWGHRVGEIVSAPGPDPGASNFRFPLGERRTTFTSYEELHPCNE